MPYIKDEDRGVFDEQLFLLYANIQSPGELNYVISYLLNNLFKDNMSYTKANELIGVLECAKLEFYRRIVAQYEDKKIIENGDVYDMS